VPLLLYLTSYRKNSELITLYQLGNGRDMPYRRKKKPNLVYDFPITSGAFSYITKRRHATREPMYETLDRILKEHERLMSDKDEIEDEEDLTV
jgi:CRISPR/Cas system CSM-associated protein Csm2 small subunit